MESRGKVASIYETFGKKETQKFQETTGCAKLYDTV